MNTQQAAIHIAIYMLKGGAGKTATAVGLAGAFVERGAATLIVDGDEQRASKAWVDLRVGRETQEEASPKKPKGKRGRLSVVAIDLSRPKDAHPAIESFNPHVIITDCPPRFRDLSSEQGAFLLVSDLVVVPFLIDADHVSPLLETLQILRGLGRTGKNCIALPIRSTSAKSGVTNAVMAAAEEICANLEIPVAPIVPFGGAKRGEAKLTGRTYREVDKADLAHAYDSLAFNLIRQFGLTF